MNNYGVSPAVRPSRLWFAVAAVLFAGMLACIFGAVAGFTDVSHRVSAFPRVPVPGQAQVTLRQPGGYLVYFEGPGQGRGQARLLLRDAATGQAVTISDGSGGTEKYTIGRHSGQSVARFTITRPGRYVLSAHPSGGVAPADVAVGQGLGGGLLAGVLLVIGAVACFVTGLLTVIFTLARRRRRGRVMIADPVWDQAGN
jgi:hypothetical protein